MPESPNSKIMANPITKGGVIIGNTLIALITRLNFRLVRVTRSAKTRPRIVVKAPTIIAIKSEFNATPHRPPPIKQPSDQIRLSVNFSIKIKSE